MTLSACTRLAQSTSRTLLLAAAAALLATATAGCAAKREPASTTRPTPAPLPEKKPAAPVFAGIEVASNDWSAMGYRLDWVGYPFGSKHTVPIVSAKSLSDAFVLLDKDGNAALLETTTGKRRWATAVANPLTKFVGIARDSFDPARILISSESDGYFVTAATGGLVGKANYAKVVNTTPLTTGRTAIFGTSIGEVLAHNIAFNVKSWGFQTNTAIEASPVALENGTFAIVNQSGEVFVLTSTGELVGRNRVLGPLATNPITDGQNIYIAGLDQSVWSFNGAGALNWRFRTSYPLRDQPTFSDGIVYVSVPGTGLVALGVEAGKQRWASKDTLGSVIAIRNNKLIVQTATGADVVDPQSGNRLATFQLPDVARLVTDKLVDGNLYVISRRGVVGKFIPKM